MVNFILTKFSRIRLETESSATIMSEGKGYIIEGQKQQTEQMPWPLGQFSATFNGVPVMVFAIRFFPDKSI
jgi:hypothetical protein